MLKWRRQPSYWLTLANKGSEGEDLDITAGYKWTPTGFPMISLLSTTAPAERDNKLTASFEPIQGELMT